MLKPLYYHKRHRNGLITVQDNTMLKLYPGLILTLISLITVQDNTMLKLTHFSLSFNFCLITVQDNTMLKLQ